MRILFSGGGTGGHVYPALTIASELRRKVPEVEILFIGTNHGLEAELAPRENYDFTAIELYGFQRKLSWRNIKNIWFTLASYWKSRRLIKEFAPDVVVGTGGYVCGPVLLAAALAKIPTLIQEQNAFPGITNRILARFVDQIALGYEEAASRISAPEKAVVTGNPVRSDILLIERSAGIAEFGFAEDRLTILVAGGSQGSHSINDAMFEVHRAFAGRTDIQILHVTGPRDYENVKLSFCELGLPFDDPAAGRVVKPYLHNMPYALAAADLAVFRSGAIGLAELTARGVPSILIPYPYAAANHQEFNARALARKGAAVVILDSELTGNVLVGQLLSLLSDRATLASMAVAAKAAGQPDAAKTIADMTVKLASKSN